MKLGIVVVYLVAEEDAALLDLHLKQIQKHTTVPYALYAGTNRLSPGFHVRLQQCPEIKICSLIPTELRDAFEHSFYLEQLIRLAIDDGVTHVAILHTDSFPTCEGWAETLASRVSTKAFAAISRGPYTACLFFTRDFYLAHQPRLLLSEDEVSSDAYKQFAEEYHPILHSGVGYFYRAFVDGLTWYPLAEGHIETEFGQFYEEMIFHLHGNTRLQMSTSTNQSILARSLVAPTLNGMRGLVRAIIPYRVRQFLWLHFGDVLTETDRLALQYRKQELLKDPEVVLDRIRARSK